MKESQSGRRKKLVNFCEFCDRLWGCQQFCACLVTEEKNWNFFGEFGAEILRSRNPSLNFGDCPARKKRGDLIEFCADVNQFGDKFRLFSVKESGNFEEEFELSV